MSRFRPPRRDYSISSGQFLEYVEDHLWGSVKRRLYAYAVTIAFVLSVLGFVGVGYFLRNQVDKHVQDAAESYKTATLNIESYAVALALLESAYNEKRSELQQSVLSAKNAIDRGLDEEAKTNAILRSPSMVHTHPLVMLFDQLNGVTEMDRFVSSANSMRHVISEFWLRAPDSYAGVRVSYPVQVSYGGDDPHIGHVQWPHPIIDGTLAGAVNDIRIRALHLIAFGEAIDDLRFNLITRARSLDQSPILLQDAQSEFEGDYARRVEQLNHEALSKQEFDQEPEFRANYIIDNVFPVQRPSYQPRRQWSRL